MRFSLVQMYCEWGEVDRNLVSVERFTGHARDNGCDMAVFPELTTTGIYKDDRVWDLAESIDGPSVNRVREIATNTGLHIGFGFTESASPLPCNAYTVIRSDGTVAGVYRKNFIPRLEIPWWQGHSGRPVFEVAGCRFGVSICWDNTCPDVLAEYGRRAADAVIMPHAWDADPLAADGTDLPHETIRELFEHQAQGRLAGWRHHDGMRDQFYGYIPGRARGYGFCALFVNQAGQPHPAIRFEGPTFAVDRQGRVVAATESGGEQALIVDLDLRNSHAQP